jgi:hypothetical protein
VRIGNDCKLTRFRCATQLGTSLLRLMIGLVIFVDNIPATNLIEAEFRDTSVTYLITAYISGRPHIALAD